MCVGARRADPSRVLLLLLLLLLLLSVSVSMLCDQVGNVKAAGLRLEEAAKDLSAPGEVGSHRSAAGAGRAGLRRRRRWRHSPAVALQS
jgi:hypothetical protein